MKTEFIGDTKAIMKAARTHIAPLPHSRKRRRKVQRQRWRAIESAAKDTELISYKIENDPITGLPVETRITRSRKTTIENVVTDLLLAGSGDDSALLRILRI